MSKEKTQNRGYIVQIERKLYAVLPLRGGRYKLDGLLVAARPCSFTTRGILCDFFYGFLHLMEFMIAISS